MANNPINQEKEEDRAPIAAASVKELLFTGIVGKVKWFNVKRGYGFVCRKDTEEDVFIHQSAIVKNNPNHQRRSVGDGEDILFDIVKGEKGNEAANVCGVDGNHVRGSEYALRYQKSGRGRPRGRGRGRGIIIRSRGPSEDYDNYPQEFTRGGPPRGGRGFRGGEGRTFRGGEGRTFRGGDRNFRGSDGRNFRGGEERNFRGEERNFGGNEERNFRGGEGRNFRGGGRPYFVQYRKPYPEYEMPPPPTMYYDYEYFQGPVRGRGGAFRGPQMFRGGAPPPVQRDMSMNFNRYDYERRPSRGGRGRFRNSRGRGGRVGPRDNVQLKDEGEEHHEEKDSGEHHE